MEKKNYLNWKKNNRNLGNFEKNIVQKKTFKKENKTTNEKEKEPQTYGEIEIQVTYVNQEGDCL